MTAHLTTAHDTEQEREASISWLRVKMFDGTAGLDPFDAAVMIVEVASPDRAWRLNLIGAILWEHPHVRPDHSTCIRVRAILEADVRMLLGLDEPGAPTLETPLASRAADHPRCGCPPGWQHDPNCVQVTGPRLRMLEPIDETEPREIVNDPEDTPEHPADAPTVAAPAEGGAAEPGEPAHPATDTGGQQTTGTASPAVPPAVPVVPGYRAPYSVSDRDALRAADAWDLKRGSR